MRKSIAIVDLFAGPGGLGEGFSAFADSDSDQQTAPFRIALSVEKEIFAHKTLRLRAFFRLLRSRGSSLEHYYKYLSGESSIPYTDETKELWTLSGEEALQLEIGSEKVSRILHAKVKNISETNEHWVLIGGPPCQAYSVVGRVRNKGKQGYSAEKDDRHFLYTYYLDLIKKYRPSVFVMENVKGILSSRVSGSGIFAKILKDLRAETKDGGFYNIYSLSKRNCVYTGTDGKTVNPMDFIVQSEFHGVPQARHRVILVGVREDVAPVRFYPLRRKRLIPLRHAISDLPKLRSGLSENDTLESWRMAVRSEGRRVSGALDELSSPEDRKEIRVALKKVLKGRLPYATRGALRVRQTKTRPSTFARKLRDPLLRHVLNHEARTHMETDLARYLFAAAFGAAKAASPSHTDFPRALAPKHLNWFSGHFSDRFRVQLRNSPSTTITCHIAKDGHYYIHHDIKQCRTLTVREAARLQTFPDNYFFEGNRTEQYIQVGNAVPPMLATQIARKVWLLLSNHD